MMRKNSSEWFTDNNLIYIEDFDKENFYLINTLFTNEITDYKIKILSSTYGYKNVLCSLLIQINLKYFI